MEMTCIKPVGWVLFESLRFVINLTSINLTSINWTSMLANSNASRGWQTADKSERIQTNHGESCNFVIHVVNVIHAIHLIPVYSCNPCNH